MMLRWQRTDMSQSTLDGIQEFTLVGVYGVEEDWRPEELNETTESAFIYHLPRLRQEPHGAMPYQDVDLVVYLQRPTAGPNERRNLHVIRCCAAWLMDDAANNLDTLVRHIHLDDVRSTRPREGLAVPTVG